MEVFISNSQKRELIKREEKSISMFMHGETKHDTKLIFRNRGSILHKLVIQLDIRIHPQRHCITSRIFTFAFYSEMFVVSLRR
jgi:hypothetical protein